MTPEFVPIFNLLGEMVFAFIFLSELLLRIAAYRCDFFTGPDMAWNLFDTMLISSQAVEQGRLGINVRGFVAVMGGPLATPNHR